MTSTTTFDSVRVEVAKRLHEMMSEFLMDTIKFHVRETAEGYIVSKEDVGDWYRAANTIYEYLDDDVKEMYLSDADLIVLLLESGDVNHA